MTAKEHFITHANEELSLALSDLQHGIIALRCLEHVRNVFATNSNEHKTLRSISSEKDPGSAVADGNSTSRNMGEPEPRKTLSTLHLLFLMQGEMFKL